MVGLLPAAAGVAVTGAAIAQVRTRVLLLVKTNFVVVRLHFLGVAVFVLSLHVFVSLLACVVQRPCSKNDQATATPRKQVSV
jgi:hypothetical protein